MKKVDVVVGEVDVVAVAMMIDKGPEISSGKKSILNVA